MMNTGDDLRLDSVSDLAPIVIGGCGRSGTTLLRVMLDSHHRIACGPETGLFTSDPVSVPLLAIKYDTSPAELAGALAAAPCRARMIEWFGAWVLRRANRVRWAEKTPRNVGNLAYILACFPRARFIHVVRDGRDVICSLRTHPRFEVVEGRLEPVRTNNPIDACIGRWIKAIKAALPFRDEPRYLEVRYEDLVRHPERVGRQICAFVGEPWDDAMLRHHETPSIFRDVTKFPQNPEAIKPIGDQAIGRWREDLTPDELLLFEQRAGRLMEVLGYPMKL